MARLNGHTVFSHGLMTDTASDCCGAAVNVFGSGNTRCDYCAQLCDSSPDYMPMGAARAETKEEMDAGFFEDPIRR